MYTLYILMCKIKLKKTCLNFEESSPNTDKNYES